MIHKDARDSVVLPESKQKQDLQGPSQGKKNIDFEISES